jgi:hypothetical protein
MTEKTDEAKNEVNKLVGIASDLELPSDVRTKATERLGNVGTHDALLALLGMAAKESLSKRERDLALKYARKIIKSGY